MSYKRCKRGHERSPENVRANGTCKPCQRDIEAERAAAKREQEGRTKREPDPLRFPCGHERAGNLRPGRTDCAARSEAVDHIEPSSAGGPNHWSNYTPACKPCNSAKPAHPLLQWMLSR